MPNDVKRKQSLVIAFFEPESGRVRRPGGRPPVDERSGGAASAWLLLGVLLAGLTGLLALLPPPTAVLTLTGTGTRGLDAAVLAGASVLVWALSAWVATVALVAAIGVLPGVGGQAARALLRVIAPRVALRLVAAAVGASALASTTACAAPIFAEPAQAAISTTSTPAAALPTSTAIAGPTASATLPSSAVPASTTVPFAMDWPESTPTDSVVLDIQWPDTEVDGPTVTTAVASPAPTAAPGHSGPAAAAEPETSAPLSSAPTTGQAAEEVTVRPGDTLWSLAQRSLPADADDAAVDTAWRQWFAANRNVIGDNPDRLEPGQILLAPSADGSTP
ncbi:LysM peptidoglycan-binding domain-containing protein [Nakamurella flava]|uniref:LysM peptidoglycan-binding domain-containing protein n=1 Tax=Nakamurella flava TaxID=2576308 RepID=A0A4U6QLP1_9ACTN|nr:LysM domain-containing protein [Nakamurella flava]TKV61507.1 LysM peptidoglycan-binding domain-containing protein [Nakamurella flava]